MKTIVTLAIMLFSVNVSAEALYFECDTQGMEGSNGKPDSFDIALDIEEKTMEARGMIYNSVTISPTMVIARVGAHSIKLSREDLSVTRGYRSSMGNGTWVGKCTVSEKKQTKKLF